jgi:hypothetical protein
MAVETSPWMTRRKLNKSCSFQTRRFEASFDAELSGSRAI